MNKFKKLFSLIAAVTLLGGTFASMTACSGDYALSTPIAAATGEVSENGGFVVKKGEYIYFINGAEEYTASNEYGEVVKGALMRIKESDVKAGKGTAETVVPMIVGSQNFESGFFIHGDYVYFATPATDENMDGEIANNWIDFKSAKISGNAEVKENYYFRLSNNAAKYRFVEEGGIVYCLYEEDGALKSFNTKTEKTTVLVKGASSSFFYNEEKPDDGNVYYTMKVTYDFESGGAYDYNQLYMVNAAATVSQVSYNETNSVCSYTVTGGKTYSFKTDYMEEANEAAEEAGNDATYNFNDYTTYPYVNLGTLVLDGVGQISERTQFNTETAEFIKENAKEPQGYVYAITGYKNDGIYLTKTEYVKTQSEKEASPLYYMPTTRTNWNTVTGNNSLSIVATDTTNASSSAIYFYNEGVHSYLYVSNNTLYKATANADGTVANKVKIASGLSGVTLWKADGKYVYYYATGTNGNNLSRVNYTGTQENYNALLSNEEYKPVTVAYVDWASAWYKPELIDGVFYFADAQTIDAVGYQYVQAITLPATQAEIKAKNEAYDQVKAYINACSSDMQKVLNYYYRTGETGVFTDAVALKLYDKDEETVFTAFKDGTAQNEKDLPKDSAGNIINKESYFITKLGAYSDADVELMNEGWANTLRHEEEVIEEETTWPTWAIIVTAVGAAIVVILLITVPVIVVNNKKKARRKAEATINAYKRKKIDTTDDKSIDVYADDSEEATAKSEEE